MPTRAELLFDGSRMTLGDQQQLEVIQLPRYQDAYIDSIQQQLDRLGSRQIAKAPTGQQLRTLEQFAARDAASITETYNRELQAQIDRMDLGNVDLETAKAELTRWAQEREAWKSQQISRATRGNAANYAAGQFIQKNGLTDARVIWYALPPVVFNSHQTCIERVGMGAVSWNEARDWQAVHPNCRHTKLILQQDIAALGDGVWRG